MTPSAALVLNIAVLLAIVILTFFLARASGADKMDSGFLSFWASSAVISLSLLIWLVYAVVHFLQKVW